MNTLDYKLEMILLFFLGAVSGRILFSEEPLVLKLFVLLLIVAAALAVNNYMNFMDKVEEERWRRSFT